MDVDTSNEQRSSNDRQNVRHVRVARAEKYEDTIEGWQQIPVKEKTAGVPDEEKVTKETVQSMANRLLVEQCSACKKSTIYEPTCRHVPWDEMELKKHALLDTACHRPPVTLPKDEMEMRRLGYLDAECQRHLPRHLRQRGPSTAASAAEEVEKGISGMVSEHGDDLGADHELSWSESKKIYQPTTRYPEKSNIKPKRRRRLRSRGGSSSSASSSSLLSGGSPIYLDERVQEEWRMQERKKGAKGSKVDKASRWKPIEGELVADDGRFERMVTLRRKQVTDNGALSLDVTMQLKVGQRSRK